MRELQKHFTVRSLRVVDASVETFAPRGRQVLSSKCKLRVARGDISPGSVLFAIRNVVRGALFDIS